MLVPPREPHTVDSERKASQGSEPEPSVLYVDINHSEHIHASVRTGALSGASRIGSTSIVVSGAVKDSRCARPA